MSQVCYRRFRPGSAPRALKGIYRLDASVLKEGEKVTVTAWPELAGSNSADHVWEAELVNQLKNEKRGFAAKFEFSNGQKFLVVKLVPKPIQ